jgi:hypothetical protein
MDIFDAEDVGDIYHPERLLFSRLINSTNSVGTKVTNIYMNEEDFIDELYPTEDILAAHCNFGHFTLEGYEYPGQKVKNINGRGRKAKEKTKSMRKKSGDGSSFNSQITFEIQGSCTREISDVEEYTKLKPGYISIEDLGDGTERITKIYKIKLFRDGTISVPGSLCEDLSDCLEPLDKLCRYLSYITNLDVQLCHHPRDTQRVSFLKSDMRNYKFRLLGRYIDPRALQNHFAERNKKFLLVRFDDILEFLLNPVFEGYEDSPRDIGWVEFMKNYTITAKSRTDPGSDFDYDALRDQLVNSNKRKDVFVMFSDLQSAIKELALIKIYEKLQVVFDTIHTNYNYTMGKETIRRVIQLCVAKNFAKLNKKFDSSENNDVSSIRYYSERFQGFIIRKKSRIPGLKPTTIKLFAKGKINIDHAKTPEEARYIYYWLNDLLLKNENLTYDPNIKPDELDPDDEWSYTDTEDMSDDENAVAAVDA